MSAQLNPYISFRDNAREAMQFYHAIFGGELHISTFKEYNASQHPDEDNNVMHAELRGEHGITFMAADTPGRMSFQEGARINMILSGDDEALLAGWFNGLSQGGKVNQPLTKAPWGDTYGSLTDRFGVEWMVNISGRR